MKKLTAGVDRCTIPEWASKKTKTAGDKINSKIRALNELAIINQNKLKEWMIEAQSGSIGGNEFLRFRAELMPKDRALFMAVETIPLYQEKLALLDEIRAAGVKEGTRLDNQAATRLTMLNDKLAEMQTSDQSSTFILRSDKPLQELKRKAFAVRQYADNFITHEDRENATVIQELIKSSLGL